MHSMVSFNEEEDRGTTPLLRQSPYSLSSGESPPRAFSKQPLRAKGSVWRVFARPRYLAIAGVLGIVLLLSSSSASRAKVTQVAKNAGIKLPSGNYPWSRPKVSAEDILDEALLYDDDAMGDELDESSNRSGRLGESPLEDKKYTETTYLDNGYVILPDEIGEDAPQHPIIDMMQRAEKEWDELLNRQSKTLSEAAANYRARYQRHPPRGFDKWWHFAMDNRVVLKDEYNQIDRDLGLFWALEPQDLRRRIKLMQIRDQTFTITADPGKEGTEKVTYGGPEARLERATDLGDLIQTFAADLPSAVSITFTRHDQPACSLSWEHKHKMMEMTKSGDYFGPSDFSEISDPRLTNWANACPPGSALRRAETNDPSGKLIVPMANHRSFIYNHTAAMDICEHPESMPLHGYTSSIGTNLEDLVPLFTFAKTVVHSDILATPLEQYASEYIGDDPAWSGKKQNRLLWRGSTTGVEATSRVQWQLSQRARLHLTSHAAEGRQDVLFASKDGHLSSQNYNLKELNEKYMDTSFAGEPLQCDDEACALMEQLIDFVPFMGLEESYQYKYVMDLDGNGWSGRFHRLMSSNSLVLKSTLFPEWYTDRIMPWVHYVPVKIDYTDLYDVLAFFVGTPDGENAHDKLAEKMAQAGKAWARDHWRTEDMAAYMFRLLLEWRRIVNRGLDDVSLDYVD